MLLLRQTAATRGKGRNKKRQRAVIGETPLACVFGRAGGDELRAGEEAAARVGSWTETKSKELDRERYAAGLKPRKSWRQSFFGHEPELEIAKT